MNGSNALVLGTFGNAVGGTLYTDSQGQTFLVSYVGNTDGGLVPNDVTLTYLGLNVVPEPSTYAGLFAGLAALGLFVVRNRRQPGVLRR